MEFGVISGPHKGTPRPYQLRLFTVHALLLITVVFPVIQVGFSNYSYTVIESEMVVDYSILVWGYLDRSDPLIINVTAFSSSAVGKFICAREITCTKPWCPLMSAYCCLLLNLLVEMPLVV